MFTLAHEPKMSKSKLRFFHGLMLNGGQATKLLP